MAEFTETEVSTEVDVWINAVLDECHLQGQVSPNGVDQKPQRAAKEALSTEDAATTASHVDFLRKTARATYAKRHEIADISKYDREMAQQLLKFDQAHEALQSNIDWAEHSTKMDYTNEALRDAINQLEHMRDALEVARNSNVKSPEEAIADLRARLDKTLADLNEHAKKAEEIQEQEEREEFEGILEEAQFTRDEAVKTLDADNFLEAEELLAETHLLMKDLEPGNAQETAKKKKEYTTAVEDTKKTIKKLSAKLSTLKDTQKTEEFNKEKHTAEDLIKKIEAAIKKGRVKSARPLVGKLKTANDKMNDCFKGDQRRANPAAKGKK